MKTIVLTILFFATVVPAIAQDALETFQKGMRKLEAQEQIYRNAIWGKNSFPQTYKDSIAVHLEEVRAEMWNLAQSAINENRKDQRFINVLYTYLRNFMSLDEYEAELDKFSSEVKKEKEWQEQKEFVRYERLNQPGNQCANFTVKDHQGKKVQLYELLQKHKLVLIDFWASWCGACRATMPHLKEIYPKYKKQGVEFLSISMDDNKEAWEKAFQEENLPWIDGSNLLGWKDPIALKYAIKGIPWKVLISHEGTIIGVGFWELGSLEEAMDTYLTEHTNQ